MRFVCTERYLATEMVLGPNTTGCVSIYTVYCMYVYVDISWKFCFIIPVYFFVRMYPNGRYFHRSTFYF